MAWLILVITLFASIATGVAVGAALGLTGLALLFLMTDGGIDLAVTAAWNMVTDYTLSAVPLFVFMGDLLLIGGLSNRIYSAVAPLFQRVPGKLLHTNIAVCTLFGAVSGSSMATAAAVGSVAYPEMVKRGYDPRAVVGSLAGGGTLGLLIPPSLTLLLYGALENVSIGKLFLAGILPGLMFASIFMIYIFSLALRRPDVTPRAAAAVSLWAVLGSLLRIWPLIILIAAVLGTLYGGYATPTESAGLGVAAAIVLGFLFGELTLRKTWEAFYNSVLVFASIGFVIIGAVILAQAISILALPSQVLAWLASLQLGKYEILIAVCAIYLVLGCFFDGTSLLLMTVPIVFPVMTGIGFDAVWLGVIITILIEVGMLTPPVGMNLFVLTAISQRAVPLQAAARASVPYWFILLAGIALLTAVPEIALVLPDLYG